MSPWKGSSSCKSSEYRCNIQLKNFFLLCKRISADVACVHTLTPPPSLLHESHSLWHAYKSQCRRGVTFSFNPFCTRHISSQTTCHRACLLANGVQTEMQQATCLFVADETIRGTWQVNKHAEAKHLGLHCCRCVVVVVRWLAETGVITVAVWDVLLGREMFSKIWQNANKWNTFLFMC